MPTPVAHTMAAAACYAGASQHRAFQTGIRSFLFITVCANLPDFDFIPGLLLGAPNAYHRGATHSFAFAMMSAAILAPLGLTLWKHSIPLKRRLALSFGFSLVVLLTHLLLDALGVDRNPPYGQPLLWPVLDTYYEGLCSVWCPFREIHKSSWEDVFSLYNVVTALREALVMTPVCALGLYLATRRHPEHT